jgi:hypothetical protein
MSTFSKFLKAELLKNTARSISLISLSTHISSFRFLSLAELIFSSPAVLLVPLAALNQHSMVKKEMRLGPHV